jgi:FlaA1/EpsC-like NDP-sugar epimerase
MPSKLFKGKKILVTGGTGSIGSEIVRELLKFNPSVVRVLDNDEMRLYTLGEEVKDRRLRLFLGDVREKERVRRATEGVHIVFHAAALKHVPICEYNPFDAIMTNVIGTQNVIDAALDEGVGKVTVISTDKAANPNNVMGATKLLAERLVVAADQFRGPKGPIFSCVRFGNVIGSRGSVMPLFENQIKEGEPLTVTSTGMTRFFMLIKDAVDLTFKSVELSKGGEVFIFKMPSLKIIDLAKAMIEELAPKYGFSPSKIKIKEIGSRPGEKIHEELMTKEEAKTAVETRDMFIILSQLSTWGGRLIGYGGPSYRYPGAKPVRIKEYSSGKKLLTKEEIKKMLRSTLT